MSKPMTQPVPANQPVTIQPVKKLTFWQQIERWFVKWWMRGVKAGAFIVWSLVMFWGGRWTG